MSHQLLCDLSHVRTIYACFPRTLEGFSLQAFLSMTQYLNFCSACAVTDFIFGYLNRSFYLLTSFTYARKMLLNNGLNHLGLCWIRDRQFVVLKLISFVSGSCCYL